MTPNNALWCAAFALFVVADVVTTTLGIRLFGAVEGHPVSASVLATTGTAGMLVAKGVVVGVAFAFARRSPVDYRIAFPIVLALFGFGITAWNTAVILAV